MSAQISEERQRLVKLAEAFMEQYGLQETKRFTNLGGSLTIIAVGGGMQIAMTMIESEPA